MTPYIYKLTHTPSGRLYIGSRFGRRASPTDFWKSYFTSSKVVAAMVENDGKECWTWEVIPRPGRNAEEVFEEEHELIAAAISELGKDAVINRFVHRQGKPNFFNGKHSDTTKKKMRAAAEARWAATSTEERAAHGRKIREIRINNASPSPLRGRPSPLKGVPKSAEHRAAMSRGRKGVVLPHMLAPKDLTVYELVNIDTGVSVSATQYDLRALTSLDAQEINNLIKGRVKRSKRWRLAVPFQPSPPPK